MYTYGYPSWAVHAGVRAAIQGLRNGRIGFARDTSQIVQHPGGYISISPIMFYAISVSIRVPAGALLLMGAAAEDQSF